MRLAGRATDKTIPRGDAENAENAENAAKSVVPPMRVSIRPNRQGDYSGSASNCGIISSKFSRAVTVRHTPFLSIRNIVGMPSMP
jgi:hypothetical protein